MSILDDLTDQVCKMLVERGINASIDTTLKTRINVIYARRGEKDYSFIVFFEAGYSEIIYGDADGAMFEFVNPQFPENLCQVVENAIIVAEATWNRILNPRA